MSRKTIQGLENYYGPIPTAFKVDSKYSTSSHVIYPWWVVPLSKYQRDNLLQLLILIFEHRGPLGTLYSGNWVEELLYLLAKPALEGTRVVSKYSLDEEDSPNLPLDAIDGRMIEWLAERISRVENIPIDEALDLARDYYHA